MACGPAFSPCLATAEEPGGSCGVSDRCDGLIHVAGCGLTPQAEPQRGFRLCPRAADRLENVGRGTVAAGGAAAAGQVRAQGPVQSAAVHPGQADVEVVGQARLQGPIEQHTGEALLQAIPQLIAKVL